MRSQILFITILVSGILLAGSNFALEASSKNDDQVNSEKTNKAEKTETNKTDETDRDENADDMRGIDGTVKDPDVSEKQRSLQPSGSSSSPQNSPSPKNHPGKH